MNVTGQVRGGPSPDSIFIDFTDQQASMASRATTLRAGSKVQHRVPLTLRDGSPTRWADIARSWASHPAGPHPLFVRQAWLHAEWPFVDPFNFRTHIDHEVAAERRARNLPPIAAHVATYAEAATMPPSACRLRLDIAAFRRRKLQDLTENDALDEGVWRGNVATDPGQYRQGYRADRLGGETYYTARGAFREMWESIHGAGDWDRDPDVLVLHFRAHPLYHWQNLAAPMGAEGEAA